MNDAARERTSILEGLASSDEELRRLAVERALALPVDEAMSHLVECLGDSSWRVRKAAVERLVACPESGSAIASMISALADGENPGRRNAAVEALVNCGRRAIPQLVSALESGDVDVRKLVVDAVAGIGDEAALGAMVATLRDPDANVRAAAADAIGSVGGDGAAEALERVAVRREEQGLVRLSALRALARLEATVDVSRLEAILDDSMLRPAAFGLLGCADDDASVGCLLKGLDCRSPSSRDAAMAALLRILSRADGYRADRLVHEICETVRSIDGFVAAAVERLSDVDLSTRLALVQFLGLVGSSDCVVPILKTSCDGELAEVALATLESLGDVAESAIDAAWPQLAPDERRNACAVVARIGGERGLARLESALEDPEPELRIMAARWLGERGARKALPTLLRRLEVAAADDDPEREDETTVLVEALVALAGGPDGEDDRDSVIERLSARLGGAPAAVRLSIARVLGRVVRAEDGELVSLLMKDSSAPVRRAGVEALARLAPGSSSEAVHLALADESPLVRAAAATALGASLDPQAIEDLHRLSRDDDGRVSGAALRAIGRQCRRLEDGETRERAWSIIEAAIDGEGAMAMSGIEALGEVGGEPAARIAARLLQRSEPELLLAAVVCIGTNGSAATVSELLPLVGHEAWAVRAEAIQTLAERGIVQAVPPILRRLETEQDEFVRDSILRALKRLER